MRIQGKLVTIDEVIVVPNWDTNKLTYDQMKTLSELLARNTKHEEIWREYQHKQLLDEIKEIFLETIDVENLYEKAQIIEKLVQIGKF